MSRSFRDSRTTSRTAWFHHKSAMARPQPVRTNKLLIELLEPRLVLAAGPLVISEFLAINGESLPDEDGDFPDWIEIHNPTEQPVVLDGWYLTDDATDRTKWQFPDGVGVLQADGYLVVFASDKDRGDPAVNLHTNFKLNGGGEYLALIRPDGQTVAHEFWPEFPEQFADYSYGSTQQSTSFSVPDGAALTYRIPAGVDASLGTTWANADFDDSSWTAYARALQVLITEAGTGSDDYVEIQNVAAGRVDTAGWVVAANNGQSRDINTVHAELWQLPNSIAADEVVYRTDDTDDADHYWGGNILWRTTGNGWVMMLDDQGKVVDFVVWGYSAAELDTLSVNVNGFDVTAADIWHGPAVPKNDDRDKTLQRSGAADQNTAADWAFVDPQTMGEANPNLTTPMSIQMSTGIGFDPNSTGIDGALQTDVAAAMYEVNASFWARIPFEVEDPAAPDSLRLRMKYNDAFVAYLNGREIARRNAPAALPWNAAATAQRSVEESLVYEEIDVSNSLDALQAGANVLAIHGLNSGTDDATFLIVPDLIGTATLYFPAPTPGGPNGVGVLGLVADTRFSVDRGFFESPFQVEISTDTPGATIRYTTDGSLPTQHSGHEYTGPVAVVTTTTLRAAAFKPGYQPTNVDTQTYILANDVIRQPARPPGFPAVWDGRSQAAISADYQMDPEVVNDPAYRDEIIDGLTSITTISIVMDPELLFGSQRGIYINSSQRGRAWEYPTSVEIIEPDGTTFQVESGIRIHGYSWRHHSNTPKHSFRLEFRDEYGPTRLEYPLFPDAPVDRFDSIVLRAQGGCAWAGRQRPHEAQYLRDTFARDTARDMGAVDGHATLVHLYLNGLYWGLYNPVERPDAQMGAEYFGGSPEDYDALNRRTSTTEAIDGDLDRYNEMVDVAEAALAARVTTDADYAELQRYLAMDDFIDWFIRNQYVTNRDGLSAFDGNNQRAIGSRVGDPQFRFFVWDMEYSIWDATDNNNIAPGMNRPALAGSQNPPRSAWGIYNALRQHPEFRLRYADHVHKHFFNGGALTPEAAAARWETRAESIYTAIIGESARWGDAKRANPYTRDVEWAAERRQLLTSYFPRRTAILLDQLRDAELYPSVDAPSFNQHGGEVPAGFSLTMAAPEGTIYYTLDGSDPRLPGGAVNSDSAQTYDGTPVLLRGPALVKSRVLAADGWSALNEAPFVVSAAAAAENLAIAELNYNPYDPTEDELAEDPNFENDDFEFIELKNIGGATVELAGVKFTDGIEFDFTGGGVSELGPGESVVIVSNSDAFATRYGSGTRVAGQYVGQLNNGGEQITLTDRFGREIVDFQYDSTSSWPGRANGKGASLELNDPATVPPAGIQRTDFMEDDGNWRSSSEYGGSPGADGAGPLAAVVINEVLTHTDDPLLDAIELHNTTGSPIEVGGWYLSDSWGWESSEDNGNYLKYRIEDGTTIDPYGYLVFDENSFNPSRGADPQGRPNDFALDGAHGDAVWLMKADAGDRLTQFADRVDFGAALSGESFGRWPNGEGRMVPMIGPTLGAANSGPRVGPLLIGELQYDPGELTEADDLEFVEIYNPTQEAVSLADWRIRGGIDYDFAESTVIGARDTLVVLPFDPHDPADADEWTAFRSHYGLTGDEVDRFVGGYSGKLDNGGESVRLMRPDDPPPGEPGFVPYVLEDEVDYRVEPPWPVAPDGSGHSLHRLGTARWGNAPHSWDAAEPTPGAIEWAEVAGRYVFYNNSAFDDPARGLTDDDAIAPDKEALLPGQQATFANYTSYAKGINGVILDVTRLAGTPTVADFEFAVGNDDDPDGWPAAPAPSSVTVGVGGGVDGSGRVTITWADNAISSQWLQVTMLASADTGLATDDVFYFGNALGEAGNSTLNAIVNTTDDVVTRNFQHGPTNLAAIDDPYDYNRDRLVNTTDRAIARNNRTGPSDMLRLITAPAVDAAFADAFVEES